MKTPRRLELLRPAWGVAGVLALVLLLTTGPDTGCGGGSGGSPPGSTTATNPTTTAGTDGSTNGGGGVAASYTAAQVMPELSGITATAVNDAGVVVGSEAKDVPTPFEWSAVHGYLPLPIPSTIVGGATPSAINNVGDVAGVGVKSAGQTRALDWTSTTQVSDIGDLGGGTATATAMNSSNQVVGFSAPATGSVAAFQWSFQTGMTNLNLGGGGYQAIGINDAGTICGNSVGVSEGFVVFPLQSLTAIPPLAGDVTCACTALGITNEVLGISQGAGGTHAFQWSSSMPGPQALAVPSGTLFAKPFGVNAAGTIVGESSPNGLPGAFTACVWSAAGKYTALTPLTKGLPSGETLTAAVAINAGGQIVALSNAQHSYLLTPVGTSAAHRNGK